MSTVSTRAPARPTPTMDRKPPARQRRQVCERQWPAYVFLTPWMIGALLLTLVPMAVSLYLSFTDYTLFDPPHWVGLRNYTEMLTDDPRYWRSVGTTMLYVVVAVPLKLGLALAVAILLKNLNRGRAFYRSAFYAPSLLGASMSIALVWRALFNDGGTVSGILDSVGIHAGGWVGNPDLSVFVVLPPRRHRTRRVRRRLCHPPSVRRPWPPGQGRRAHLTARVLAAGCVPPLLALVLLIDAALLRSSLPGAAVMSPVLALLTLGAMVVGLRATALEAPYRLSAREGLLRSVADPRGTLLLAGAVLLSVVLAWSIPLLTPLLPGPLAFAATVVALRSPAG
ncbi:carbohydrate ABC transporter permease [Streptomyces sp. NPDC055144]